MAITVPHTGSNVRSTSGTTLAVTLSGTPASGSILVAVVGGFTNVTSITGGGVTTWAKVSPPNQGFAADANHNDADLWWGVIDGTPSTGVTVNFASTTFMGAHVLEIAGASQTVDTSVSFANDASATTDTKSITPVTNGSVIISGFSFFNNVASTYTAPTGYTNLTRQASGSSAVGCAYLIQTTAGASSMNWTALNNTGGNFPSVGAVAIQPASTGTNVTAPAGVITLGAVAPTLAEDNAETAPAGLLTLSAVAPTVASGTLVSPPAGLITLTAVAPVVAGDNIQTAPAGVLTLSAVAPTLSISGTGSFGTLYSVGRGIMDSQRSIVRTASGRIYIFAAEDRPLTVQTSPDTSEETSPFLRAYKASQSNGIPTSFVEQDTAHRPKTGSNTIPFCVPDVRLDSSGVVHLIYQKWVSSTTSDLIYNTFDTTTDLWGTAATVTSGINSLDSTWKRSFYAAALTLDTSDKPQVVYGNGSSIGYKTRSSGSWSTETVIHSATETAPAHFNAVTNSSGDIFVVWVGAPLGATSDIRFTQRISGTWLASPETVISGAETASNLDQTPGIALNGSGNPVALYITNSAEIMAVKTRSGGAWGTADSSGVDTHAPGIYMAGNDIYLGEGHSIGTTPDIQSAWVSKPSGGAWSAEHVLTQDSTQKDGSASMRYESWRVDPFPQYIDVAYMDEDIDDTSSTNHFAQVFYAAIAPTNVSVVAPAGVLTLSAVAPAAVSSAASAYIEPAIGRGLIPGLSWRLRANRN